MREEGKEGRSGERRRKETEEVTVQFGKSGGDNVKATRRYIFLSLCICFSSVAKSKPT